MVSGTKFGANLCFYNDTFRSILLNTFLSDFNTLDISVAPPKFILSKYRTSKTSLYFISYLKHKDNINIERATEIIRRLKILKKVSKSVQ